MSRPKNKKDQVVRLIPARPIEREDWLDDEAKQLLRLGAMRLMREVAGVDDEGNPREMNSKSAKEAIVALSLLFDRVPDVLTFGKRSNGERVEEELEAPTRCSLDLLSPEGRQEIVEAVRDLPDDIIESAIAETDVRDE
jgi:hypothetical protein